MAGLMSTQKGIGLEAPARYSGLVRKNDQSLQIAEQLKALQSMDLIALRDEWRKLKGSEPPRLSRDLMLRAVAHALQMQAFGELPPSTIKKLEVSIGEVNEVTSLAEPTRRELSAGARLVREWHGRTHSVEVLHEGFLFEGKVYRSLSEIARRITGSHWSGPRFFGLTGKRK
jgi:Protein of unknown function (DUF2924)